MIRFYFSAVCYDRNADKLVVSDARRDGSLDDTDAILFILDTYKDGQNGFLFGTNSVGIEYDAQVDNEGQGNFVNNGQQGGVIGGFNINWDATWKVKTLVSDFGWSAEFAIPLKTLRFNPGENQSWGFNVQRNIRKTNEVVYLVPMPIDFDIKRLSLAGSLDNLNLKRPGNLKVIPYALTKITNSNESNVDMEFDTEFGADIKYSLTSSLTLDLTYNTDFAQVEVDEQQVNLDRFNLFFPEKRGFFLENAGLFSVGSSGEVDLFFTRKIGIGEEGEQVPIIAGARLSGKLNNTNVGFLSMFTDEIEESGIEKNNFTVSRVNHEFKGRSSIGALFVNKKGLQGSDQFNRTYAIDGKFGIGNKAQLKGYYARTNDSQTIDESKEHSFKLNARYEWAGLTINGGYTEVGDGFNPEVGFLSRRAFRKPEFLILYRIRPKESSSFLELRPHVSYRGYWNFEGFRETSFLHIDNHWEFKSGLEIHTGINFTGEGVVDSFEIIDDVVVPEGSYNHAEAQIVFFTNSSKAVSINTRTVIGGFFGGNRISSNVDVNFRWGDKFNTEIGIRHNDVNLPGGDFTTDIFKTRLSYSFSPSINLQGLIQYNSVNRTWSSNFRFGWLKQANSGLFVVFNQARVLDGLLDPNVKDLSSSSFIVKYSYVFDVLK